MGASVRTKAYTAVRHGLKIERPSICCGRIGVPVGKLAVTQPQGQFVIGGLAVVESSSNQAKRRTYIRASRRWEVLESRRVDGGIDGRSRYVLSAQPRSIPACGSQ